MSEALQQIGYTLTLYVTLPILLIWLLLIIAGGYHR